MIGHISSDKKQTVFTVYFKARFIEKSRNSEMRVTAPYTADTPCTTGLWRYTAIQRARIQPRYTVYSLYTIQPYTPPLWLVSTLLIDSVYEVRYPPYIQRGAPSVPLVWR